MEDAVDLPSGGASSTVPASENPNPDLSTVPPKSREEGELSTSDDAQENPDSSPVQSSHAAVPDSVPLAQKITQGGQGGSNDILLQTSRQTTSQKSLKNNQLPPKSSQWTGHVGTDKNLVISFSDDDSGSDHETKGDASRLDSNIKRPSSSLEKSNKLQSQQSARSLRKEIPKRPSLNRTHISSVAKVIASNSKGAGSMPVVLGSRAKIFNPMNRNLANRECGRDQAVISNDNKLQDLRQQIALRESELKLKAAQQTKESASVLGRDPNLKNFVARKSSLVSTGTAQFEAKEPDKKRLKPSTSFDGQVVGSQPEVPALRSISASKDSTLGNRNPQERNKVDHSQKGTQLCIGESTTVKSQRQSGKHIDISSQNMPCRARDGDVNYGCNVTEKSSKVDPCVAVNQIAVPENMTSNSLPRNSEALIDAVPLNHNDNAHVLEHSNMDLQSFFGMEELIDKELEEAQEHRHKCEIEERNALKVYLKAQRSLLEANARCANLYHKREVYSAKLRSLILNNSNFSWPSGQHQHLDIGLNYLPRLGHEIPTSSCHRQAGCNDINNPSFDNYNQGINKSHRNRSYNNVTGANLGSEPCGEPDASTSERLPPRRINIAGDGGYSPSDDVDTSPNENEEISPAGQHVSNHLDSTQDSLLLEATLRSELFARLGTRAMKNSSQCHNLEPGAERGAENEVGSEKSQVHHSIVPLSRSGNNDLKGTEKRERSTCVDSSEIQSQQNIGGNSSNENCSAGSGSPGDMPCQSHHSTNAVDTQPLIFRSAFSKLREMSPFNSNRSQSKDKFIHPNDAQSENATCLSSDGTNWSNMLGISMPVTVRNLLYEESSYGCTPAVDPFWPLCMYELRGKCNNDECPWQHAKDYSDGSFDQHQRNDSKNADSQGRSPLHQHNSNGVTEVPRCHKATILPTYHVGLDILKADQYAYKPVVAHRNTECWQRHFSVTLAASNLLQNGLPADISLSHGGDERIEVHGAWSKQLSSLQWRSGAGNQIKQAVADSEQAIEMALLILNQEINKLQGVRKALSILSKALESDPTSVVLWIVYLLIYYGNLKEDEKDDMFLGAVKLCEGSYILWLMYIHSRKKLNDRLAAFESALSALCQHASAASKDIIYESACILDLFLQMLDCLCMSGNVEKAIQRSYGIFPATTNSDEPHQLSLSDILNCLTISDKCVFWVCCVYLVIYRKLPAAVVQKFECEKDLLDIEWPFVSLSEDDKVVAVKVVETAVESIDLYVYKESVKSEVNLRSAQLFAFNHLRCIVALGSSIECLRNLLDKYIKLYPSCIELILASARMQKQDSSVDSFIAFEEAISKWPKEVPGIQCIWNQYIENVIHHGRIDHAKEISVRWFHSVWQVQDLSNGVLDTTDGGNSSVSLSLDSKSVSYPSSYDHKQMDMVFGFLNLSLYKFFQNNMTEACIAVDKARNTVSFGGLEKCLRKHVMFLVCDALSLKEENPNTAIKKILELYMDGSSQDLLVPKALTRKFVDNIKKPRVQHLICNMICPVSLDCSLLNLTLQSWFGSSLLPQTVNDPKQLVDFVEGIMEVVPCNFELAITVCKLLLSKGYNSSDLNSASLWFWACSTLVNAISDAIPIPPEHIWAEAAGFFHNATGIEAISARFYRRALSVYPFSIMLWKCFYKLYKTIGDANEVVAAAKEWGMELNQP